MERVRDQNFRAMYGAWDVIKNVEKRYPAHKLNWVAYVAGKRESRRLLGDVILTAEDLRDGTVFEDGSFPCTWGIDTHFPHPKYAEGHEGDEFIADYTHGEGYTYKGPVLGPLPLPVQPERKQPVHGGSGHQRDPTKRSARCAS